MGIRICPKCGGKVSTSRNNCIHCGYVFPTTKTCPDCGEEIDINAKECPICGYPFEQEAINEAPVQPEPVLEEVKEEPVLEEVKEEPVLEEVKEEEVLEEVKQEELVEAAPITPIKTVEVVSNKVIASDALRCPYCNEPDLMEIGVDFFMCNTCKGRFLNTSDQKASAVAAAAVPLVEAPVVAPLVEAPAEQPVLEEVQEQPVLEEVKEASAPIEEAQPAEEPVIQEPVFDEPAEEATNEPIEEASQEQPVEKAPKEKPAKEGKDKKKLFVIIGAAAAVLVITLGVLTPTVFVPQGHYSKAMSLVRNSPIEAMEEFEKCRNYRDAREQHDFAYARYCFMMSDYEAGISYMLNSGGTVVAKYTTSSADIEIPSQTLNKQSDKLVNPSVEGYNFLSKSLSSFGFSNDNHKVTLKFTTTWKALSYSLMLTFKNSSYGNVYVDGNLANESTSYAKKYATGSIITLKAAPKSGRMFTGWYVDNEQLSTDKIYELKMPGHNYNVVARFA